MPMATAAWGRIAYRVRGSIDSFPVVFLHTLLADSSMWERVVARLEDEYRVICVDARGHGVSDAPPGPYSFESLAQDVSTVLDGEGLDRAHIVGSAFGGMIAQCFAAKFPQRVQSLVLSNSAAVQSDPVVWANRIAQVKSFGVASIADSTLKRWFTPHWLASGAPETQRVYDQIRATPLAGYIGCAEAVRELSQLDLLPAIRAGTLVIGGANDLAMPFEASEVIHRGIPGSSLVKLEPGSHLCAIELSDEFSSHLRRHFIKYS